MTTFMVGALSRLSLLWTTSLEHCSSPRPLAYCPLVTPLLTVVQSPLYRGPTPLCVQTGARLDNGVEEIWSVTGRRSGGGRGCRHDLVEAAVGGGRGRDGGGYGGVGSGKMTTTWGVGVVRRSRVQRRKEAGVTAGFVRQSGAAARGRRRGCGLRSEASSR
ncbi:uncharacterized protein A4U43_C08F28840 [Asparagus officinalis]|nr:uncharacterized protein A4U43_C08F28840 [Asparagus officinalis]